jgi:hypothetical protein
MRVLVLLALFEEQNFAKGENSALPLENKPQSSPLRTEVIALRFMFIPLSPMKLL